MFESSKNVIIQVEMALLNLKTIKNPTAIQEQLSKYLTFYMPNKYILIGLTTFLKPLKEFIIMIIYIIIALIIINIVLKLDIPLDNIFYVFFVYILYIPFALPSTYIHDNIEKIHITKTLEVLNNNGFQNINQIEFFEKNLIKFKLRTVERINAIKWIVGASWTLVIFFYSQYVTISSSLIKNDFIHFIKTFIDSFSIPLAVLIAIIIFIASYKRGVDFIFNSIDFALIELKYKNKCN
jgi:hypothetical protein